MKVVVAEDDLVTREILKRILSHMADEIFEASDGLEALELVEKEDPDFLFTDLHMPTLDGMAVVEAVRASKSHNMLPIVCLSAVRERDEIMKLVGLGISDYILKPIRPADVHERVRRVVAQNQGWRKRQGNDGTTTLMVVDPDPNFRQFAIPLLEGDYDVTEAISGSHALRAWQEAELKPTIILVAEGLPLVSEEQLVALVTRMARETRSSPPQFWLVTDADQVPIKKSRHFTGVIRRTFVPEHFMDELHRTVLKDGTPTERLRRHLHDGARSWLVTATRQTLGVLSGQEVTALPDEEHTITNGVCGRITLSGESSVVETILACGRGDAERLAGKVLRREATLESGASDVFGEMSNTIGGRARAALLQHDFDLAISRPDLDTDFTLPADAEWDLSAWFATADGDRFFVGMRVSLRESSAEPSALERLSAPGGATPPPSAGAPGDAPAESSVEDALF